MLWFVIIFDSSYTILTIMYKNIPSPFNQTQYNALKSNPQVDSSLLTLMASIHKISNLLFARFLLLH